MKIRKFTALIFTLLTTILWQSACSSQPPAPGQTAEIKRGDLNIIVTSDGSLNAPDQFNLAFGSQGTVQSILVREGEQIRQGALMALLDPISKINNIKTSLFSVQKAQNAIATACGSGNQLDLPYNYPDFSVSRMANEAQKDMAKSATYFNQENYKEAGYWLAMTYFDIVVCENLIKTRPNVAELAGAKNNSVWSPDTNAGGWQPISPNNQEVIAYLQMYRSKLLGISNDMKDPNVDYATIAPNFESIQQEMSEVVQAAKSTVAIKGRMIYEYADTPASADFLQYSLRLLEELNGYLSSNNYQPNETIWSLYTAKVNLLVGRDVLENQTLIFESGGKINWQNLQQYNLDLQKAEIDLYIKKLDIMNTVIIAPADGTIFSVNLKVNDPLSAEDYSARPAVGLVNTRNIKFKGKVDEIDVMKVHVGDNVTINVDAIPNKEFVGKVKFISPFGAKSGNVVKFDVTIALAPDEQLKDGLRATAEIMASSVKNALLVPVSYIISTPGGSMVILADNTTSKAEPKRVTIGLQNFQYAEVTSGLSEGDKVQLPGKAASGPNTGQQRQSSNPGNAMRALH
jgi:multidrug efflux pump subunit AcrA (membrane-fusion protein)